MAPDNETLLARYAAEHYERHSISQRRRRESHQVLGRLIAELEGRTLIELTPSDLMAWQGRQLKRGVAPTTVRKYQNMIRSFVGWAFEAQLIDFETMTRLKSINGVRGGGVQSLPKPYKRDEVMEFRELIAQRWPLLPTEGQGSHSLRTLTRRGRVSPALKRYANRLMIEAKVALALEAGLRRIEIYRVGVDDIHPDNEAVVVMTAKGKPGEHREREVPFTDHARQCCGEWIELRALIAPKTDCTWLTFYEGEVRGEKFEHHNKALGTFGSHWRWHRLRHTFATERLRAGMPLEQVQVMMGHARIEQTLAYAQIVSADVRAEARRTAEQFARNIGLETDAEPQ